MKNVSEFFWVDLKIRLILGLTQFFRLTKRVDEIELTWVG